MLSLIENVENHLMTKQFSHHFYVEKHYRKCENEMENRHSSQWSNELMKSSPFCQY